MKEIFELMVVPRYLQVSCPWRTVFFRISYNFTNGFPHLPCMVQKYLVDGRRALKGWIGGEVSMKMPPFVNCGTIAPSNR